MNKPAELKTSEIIIFKTEDEKISVDVRFEDENVWLSIDNMAKLFEKSRSTINEHILNIYAEKELIEIAEALNCTFDAKFIFNDTGEII